MLGFRAMTPKSGAGPVEDLSMSLNFLARSRITANCKHESTLRMEVAGMSREVCEACGRVSLGYVENHCRTRLVHSAADSPTGTPDVMASVD
jgi:hypothetical protein